MGEAKAVAARAAPTMEWKNSILIGTEVQEICDASFTAGGRRRVKYTYSRSALSLCHLGWQTRLPDRAWRPAISTRQLTKTALTRSHYPAANRKARIDCGAREAGDEMRVLGTFSRCPKEQDCI